MVEWHHQLTGYEFEQTPGDSEGQGSLACCSPQSCKELDTTEQLNFQLFSFTLQLNGLIFMQSRDSQESSPTPLCENINSSALSLLYGPTLTSIHDYWKNDTVDYTDLQAK